MGLDSFFQQIDADALIADSIGKLQGFRLSDVDAWVRGDSEHEGRETPTTPRNS